MASKPASASSLMVPGKSFAMSVLTGHVWQPIGIPSGAARRPVTRAASNAATAASAVAFARNSRLVTPAMRTCLVVERKHIPCVFGL